MTATHNKSFRYVRKLLDAWSNRTRSRELYCLSDSKARLTGYISQKHWCFPAITSLLSVVVGCGWHGCFSLRAVPSI